MEDAAISDIRSANRLAKVRLSTGDPDIYQEVYRCGGIQYRHGVLEFSTDDVDETLRWIQRKTGSLNNVEVVNDALSAASRHQTEENR